MNRNKMELPTYIVDDTTYSLISEMCDLALKTYGNQSLNAINYLVNVFKKRSDEKKQNINDGFMNLTNEKEKEKKKKEEKIN